MNRAEFDKFADEYTALHASNISASGEDPEYFGDYKMRDLQRLVSADRASSKAARFLDFGAGVGSSVPHFRKYFPEADLVCTDVSMKSLGMASTRFPGEASFVAFDGRRLPFADATFDYAYAACVFHHIPVEAHVTLLAEMWRVLKPGGQVMIYEHNPLNPLTVRAVDTCPFDENAVLIRGPVMKARLGASGFRLPRIRYRVFFPHSLRWIRGAEGALGWLPLGAQYYAWGRR